MDETKKEKKLCKRNYQARAYGSAFKSFYPDLPTSPDNIDWSKYFKNGKQPKLIELGCGYGKFLMNTAKLFPEENILGFELRPVVYDYVRRRIIQKNLENAAVMEYNALLYLPNILQPKSVEKIFILYPDPRIQSSMRKGRIVNKRLFAVLEYLLSDSGVIFFSTDLKFYMEEIKCEIQSFNSIDFEERRFISIEERMTKIASEDIYINNSSREEELIENCYKNTNESARSGLYSGEAFCCIYRIERN